MANVFRQGEHICVLYETKEEQRLVAAEYVADGLRQGERCLYVDESRHALAAFHASLAAMGIDAPSYVSRGALIEATHDEAHLLDGVFDTERMIRMLNEAVERALTDGFAGLRCCGDMSWLLREASGSEQVVQYEAVLNGFFTRMPACGMCQYDQARLSAHAIDHALATHSSVLLEGVHKANLFYTQPEIARQRRAVPEDLPWKLSELRRRP